MRIPARTISLCLVLLVFSPHARGAEPALAADPLAAAIEAFEALDYEGALGRLLATETAGGLTERDRVRLLVLRAKCALSLGKTAEAEAVFAAALSIDPGLRLDADTSPRFAEPFARVLALGVAPLEVELLLPDRLAPGAPLQGAVELRADPTGVSDRLVLHHRESGAADYQQLVVELVRGRRIGLSLPLSEAASGLEWWSEVLDRYGSRLQRRGDPEHPLRVDREPTAPPPALAEPAPAAAQAGPAWYERWWVWAVVGGVTVAVVGITAGVLAGGGGADTRDFTLVIQ